MTHDDIRELLPAYVLGALEADEAAAVETHLRTCREHDDELIEFRATTLALGTLAEEHDASPRLAARINRLAEGERTTRVRRARWTRWTGAAAAVVLLFAVFGAGWFSRAQFAAPPPAQFSYVVRGAGDTLIQFDGTAGREVVHVTMAGLVRLTGDSRYQLWAIRDGHWLRIGVCNTNAAGRWDGDFSFAVAPHEEIAVTIEPVGGSVRPTAEPLLQTRF